MNNIKICFICLICAAGLCACGPQRIVMPAPLAETESMSASEPIPTIVPEPSPEYDQYPEKTADSEKVPSTGPAEDFMVATFGLLSVAGAIYAAWNYRLSRLSVKKSMLKN